ncbi:MAG: hypothetical protein ACKO7N_05805 [Candidatus Nitrosotenuis sp.]
MPKYNPKQLYDRYSNGWSGCIYEPHVFDYFMENAKYAYFSDGAKKIKNSGKGQLSRPYLSYLKLDKGAFTERQTTGDCTSHSTRNACDISRAVEIDINKEKESWIARGATEAIYGNRGHSGDGSSCARTVEFVSVVGGIIVRQNYPGVANFTKYDANMGIRWGGRGLPDKVLDVANDRQMKTASLVRTLEEARDALANGYGLTVCSNQGFSNKRDNKGFAKAEGSWAHAMCWAACDDTGNDMSFLVCNSWGLWNSGGHPEWGKLPDGSFLIHSDVAEKMIKQNGAFAISHFDGFPLQKLPSYGFEDYL